MILDDGDWIGIVQTTVLAATGGIVYWYTKETRGLRKSAQEQERAALLQAEAARSQARAMARQLEIVEERRQQELHDRERRMVPRFTRPGARINPGAGATIDLLNRGAEIRDVRVAVPDKSVELVKPHHRPVIKCGGKLPLEVTWEIAPRPDSITIVLTYLDPDDRRRRTTIRWGFVGEVEEEHERI